MWEGKPKWNGEINPFQIGTFLGKFFPIIHNEPFLIKIEGSEDFFFFI